jgi:hypothetical protein
MLISSSIAANAVRQDFDVIEEAQPRKFSPREAAVRVTTATVTHIKRETSCL